MKNNKWSVGLKRGLKKGGVSTLANIAIQRELNKWDTIYVIAGERGVGKSTLGLHVLKEYINIKYEEGLMDHKWRNEYFEKNFALNTADAIKKFKKIPERSFLFIDEGGDVAYSSETMAKIVRNLIKLVAKIRQKRIFTIICLPHWDMLVKRLLEMTHLVIIVPYRFQTLWAYAFVYAKNPNMLVSKDGYGFDTAKKILEKGQKYDYVMAKRTVCYDKKKITEIYPKQMFNRLASIPSFKLAFRYRSLPKDFEEAYIKYVKSKQLYQELDFDLVPLAKYKRLEHMYNTVLWNLYHKDGKSFAQLERLHIDNQGNCLRSASTIRKKIDILAHILSVSSFRSSKSPQSVIDSEGEGEETEQ